MLDANKLIAESKAHMQKAIDHLEVELTKIRAGRANPSMLDMIQVDYYGTRTPLAQVASISTPDARSLAIQPWEKTMIRPIEKAILDSNLGFPLHRSPRNSSEDQSSYTTRREKKRTRKENESRSRAW